MKFACACLLVIAGAGTGRAQTPNTTAPPPAPTTAPPTTAPPTTTSPPSPPSDAPAPADQAPAVDQPAAEQTPPAEDNATDSDKGSHDDKDTSGFASDQGDITGDDKASVSMRDVRFRFLFQTRYAKTFLRPIDATMTLDPRLSDGYALNRIFLRATTKPKSWLAAKLLVDFAELTHKSPKHALKLAYTELRLHKRASLTVGLFKRTYSLLELLPIADFELADVGPTDTLIKDAELAGRDPGVMLRVDPLPKRKWMSIYVGMYDGGLGGVDARPPGLVTGRVVARPIKHLHIGVDGAWRYHGQTPAAPGVPIATGPGRAVGADAMYTRKHFELRAEWLWGTRSDELYAGQAKTFMSAWVIGAVKIPVDRVVVMPAGRFEWLDADREHPIGRRYYITSALNVMDPTDTFRVVLDVSRSQVQAGSFPLSVVPTLLDVSSTIVVVQAQVKI